MKEKIIITGVSLLLIVIAFLIRDWVLSFSIALIMNEKLFYIESSRLPYQVFPFLIFILSFGLLPFLYLFVKNRCNLLSLEKKIMSVLIIIFFGLVFYTFRIIYLKFQASQINDLLRRAEFAREADIPRMRFEDMNLEYYLLAGLIVGTFISLIILKKSSNNENKIHF